MGIFIIIWRPAVTRCIFFGLTRKCRSPGVTEAEAPRSRYQNFREGAKRYEEEERKKLEGAKLRYH